MQVEIDWIRQLGSIDYDTATGLAVDQQDYIYVTGSTQGILKGGSSKEDTEMGETRTDIRNCDPWLAKYDRLGNQVWLEQLCTLRDDYALGITVGGHGYLYLTGITSGELINTEEDMDWITTWIAKYDHEGKQVWMRRLGHLGDSYSHAIVADQQGNIVITGYTSGLLEQQNQSDHIQVGDYDAWVAKYNPDGHQIWLRQFGSNSSDYARSLALDSQNRIYIAGYTSGLIQKDVKCPGECDAWLAKYDAEGNQLWIRQFGSSDHEIATGVAVSYDDTIYIIGYTSGWLAGAGGYLGETDAWLAKYNQDGDQLWIVQLGTSYADYAYGVTTDRQGFVYLTGSTGGSLEGGGGQIGENDAWVAKYDETGKQIWIKQLGTKEPDTAQAIALDRQGGIYLTGATSGTLEGGGGHIGGMDAWVARLREV